MSEISEKMWVPKRMNVDGESIAESRWMTEESVEMRVPERIIISGDGSHYGAKAFPREIIMDKAPHSGYVRVQTPPKVITIDSQYDQDEYELSPPQKLEERRTCWTSKGEDLEEVVHLRKQLVKLNRRIMLVELDNLKRKNRDKVVCAIGLAYFFLKTVIWLARS